MLTLRFVRENPDVVRKDLEKRKDADKLKLLEEVLKLDEEWRKLKMEAEQLRKQRNDLTNEVRKLKTAGKDASKVLKEVKSVPEKIAKIEEKQKKAEDRIKFILMRLPNILHESVVFGLSEEDNIKLRDYGKPKKDDKLISHVDILEKLDLVDTDRAAKVSGSRFYYMKNDLVLLDIALQMYALDVLAKNGYTAIMPPYMIRKKYYEGVTDLADFENVMYRIESRDEESEKEEDTLHLIATSEHAMAAMHADEIMEEKQLPLRYAGVSPCFRREAGSHGKDTKGIFRVHQFNKVEQFIFCTEEKSWELFEELLANAENLYKKLELPFRTMSMCTAEMGTVAAKKVDLEVWMPAQQAYREVVSCSNCTAYQSARLNIRYRTKDGNKLMHTLNSTAIATTRTIVAILENYQQKDGSVLIPKVLQPYMQGRKKIGKK